MEEKTLVLLTLKRHEEGIWIRRLVRELKQILHPVDSKPRADVIVKVSVLEEWMGQGWLVSHENPFHGIVGIVNRVSDAAEPFLFKACCAILQGADSMGVPVFNGPTSYSLCASKWCQHLLFQRAGLKSPPTRSLFNTTETPASIQHTPGSFPTNVEGKASILVKPNSGGFGVGIAKEKKLPEKFPVFEDGITLIQQYIPPKDRELFRVWFLTGKVQCGIIRTLGHADDDSEFTGACAGGTCSIQAPDMRACSIPLDVRQEIETKLLPLIPDAHCGSIEFLYSMSSERMYFDLNLLSTLPLRVEDPDGVWGENYNPWKELAEAICKRLIHVD